MFRFVATEPSRRTAGVCFQTTGISHQVTTTGREQCSWHYAAFTHLHKISGEYYSMNIESHIICIWVHIISSWLWFAGVNWQPHWKTLSVHSNNISHQLTSGFCLLWKKVQSAFISRSNATTVVTGNLFSLMEMSFGWLCWFSALFLCNAMTIYLYQQ